MICREIVSMRSNQSVSSMQSVVDTISLLINDDPGLVCQVSYYIQKSLHDYSEYNLLTICFVFLFFSSLVRTWSVIVRANGLGDCIYSRPSRYSFRWFGNNC
jgi:hypothetical protein